MSNDDLARIATHRWRRYETPTLDYDDLLQIGRIAAWRLGSDRRDSTIARVSNAARNARRDDWRARNPSCGPNERVFAKNIISIDLPTDENGGSRIGTVADTIPGPPDRDAVAAIDILAAVDKLPPRLRSIIMRRYLDGSDQDQRELAETDGVSRAYIGQLEQKALAKLRKLLG